MQGWVKIFSYTQPREAILDYDRYYVQRKGEWQAASIREGKRHGKSVIAHFEGVDDRDQAAAYIDLEIAISRQDMPAAEDAQISSRYGLCDNAPGASSR